MSSRPPGALRRARRFLVSVKRRGRRRARSPSQSSVLRLAVDLAPLVATLVRAIDLLVRQ